MSVFRNSTFVGLDAHAKSINVAVMLPGSGVVDEQWQIAHDGRSLRRLAKRLLTLAPGEVRAVYEAGPCGYALKRTLDGLGVCCQVVAPSLVPVKPGERVKTDRRDARKLAALFKGGLLTVVHPPNETEEALRDLMRAREDGTRETRQIGDTRRVVTDQGQPAIGYTSSVLTPSSITSWATWGFRASCARAWAPGTRGSSTMPRPFLSSSRALSSRPLRSTALRSGRTPSTPPHYSSPPRRSGR